MVATLLLISLFLSCSRSSVDKSGNGNSSARVIDFETTGFLKDAKDPLRFHPLRAFDGDPATCWAEGDGLSGGGESVTVVLDKPVRVDAVGVIPGYFDMRLFRKNNRLKKKLFISSIEQMD